MTKAGLKDFSDLKALKKEIARQAELQAQREAARLQGFPDWFVFHPTKWHSFRQIGNSVSPIVAERIMRPLAQTLL